ncbi:dynein axonemal heavy chain 7 [Colletes latitarsis]|uniref:dynein axonemal heavy chain 7 n=1 Tax=Colletes latitarsis TaxID=2605962 RepID=UPI0040353BCC
MKCDCEEVISCEGISRSAIQKELAKDIPEISKVIDTKIERFVAGLVVKPELSQANIDLNTDQDVNRYYNYICNGVDTFHAVQIQDDVVEKILNLVPYSLQDRFNYCTEDLLVEIKDTFTTNIKRAILEFALQDRLREHLFEAEQETRLLPTLVGQVWEYRETLRNNLYLINPCMTMTLEQWVCKFRNFRLIDLKQIAEHEESWNLTVFANTLLRQINKERNALKNTWYSGIQDIFLVNNRKNLVPSPLQRTRFKRFFECAAKIMEGQLLSVCKHSLRDFMDLIIRDQLVMREFNVHIIVSSEQLIFDPSFDEFKNVLCGILDSICEAVKKFTKLETQLYLDWSGPLEILKPQIDEAKVNAYKQEIIDLIDRERLIPEKLLNELRTHERLYNNQEYQTVEQFVKDESKTLEEYDGMIKFYHDLMVNIPVNIDRTEYTGFFKLSRKMFIETIVDNVGRIKCLLTDTLVNRYQNAAKK